MGKMPLRDGKVARGRNRPAEGPFVASLQSACRECGADVPSRPRGGAPRVYCGDACRGRYHARHSRAAARAGEFAHASCWSCGAQFTASSPAAKFCSVGCRDREHNRRAKARGRKRQVPAVPRACTVGGCGRLADGYRKECATHRQRVRAGRAFAAECLMPGCDYIAAVDGFCSRTHGRGRVCSVNYSTCHCGEIFVRRGRRHCATSPVWQSRIAELACSVCGEPARKWARSSNPTCSRRCAAQSPAARDARRAARALRRLRKHNQLVEKVSPRRVFERDGWRCGICGHPIKRNVVVPHPMAGTVDHIVPLAAGGEHSYANTQCAHFLCNSRKSDGEGQLRLAI